MIHKLQLLQRKTLHGIRVQLPHHSAVPVTWRRLSSLRPLNFVTRTTKPKSKSAGWIAYATPFIFAGHGFSRDINPHHKAAFRP